MHARDFCIVVAEDDEILRYCTVRLLKEHGYRIIEARDGQEALELVEKCNDEVHLLVTNHEMPRMNGAELARRLKEKHQRLVVLLISGADHGLESSTDFEVLPKPYNEALLASKVRELLRRAGAEPQVVSR
jgi:two-component system cell cycle sensor histidine kinase/response regulator CckA